MSDIELTPSASPKRAIPIGRPIAMTDPNATSRMRTATTRPITSPMPVPGSSNAKNRSPPSSTCSTEPALKSAPSALRFSRSTGSSSSSTGYWTRIRATRPSCETSPLVTADSGPAASAPAGSPAESTWGRADDGCLYLGQRSARLRRAEERRVRIAWCQHHLGREAGPVRPGVREQVGGLLRVEPRRSERVLELLPERARRAEDEHRHDEPGPDDGPGAAGREAPQPVQSMRHRDLLR